MADRNKLTWKCCKDSVTGIKVGFRGDPTIIEIRHNTLKNNHDKTCYYVKRKRNCFYELISLIQSDAELVSSDTKQPIKNRCIIHIKVVKNRDGDDDCYLTDNPDNANIILLFYKKKKENVFIILVIVMDVKKKY
jgi:hypothetical protein